MLQISSANCTNLSRSIRATTSSANDITVLQTLAIRKDFRTHRRLYFILRGRGFQRDVTVVDIFQDEFFQPLERIAIAAAPSLLEADHGARGDRARLHPLHLLPPPPASIADPPP